MAADPPNGIFNFLFDKIFGVSREKEINFLNQYGYKISWYLFSVNSVANELRKSKSL